MIASLRGTVIDLGLGSAVIECAGVGYQVLAAPRTLAELRRGEEAFVLTKFVVREDAQTLYGFLDADSRDMFVLLQTVSGLGPRLALAAQAVYTTGELAAHIRGGDAKALQKIPGVGKRMAERLIVDLKDKVAEVEELPGAPAVSAGATASGANLEQVIEALVGLGFREKDAEATVAAVASQNPELATGEVLRSSLNALGSKR